MGGRRDPRQSPGHNNLLAELLAHLTRHLDPLLPQSLMLLTADLQVLLVSTSEGYPRTISTLTVQAPPEPDVNGLEAVARYALVDIQDLVVMHLRTPWPLAPSERVTHAWTERSDSTLKLGFRTAEGDAEDTVLLPDFVIQGDSGINRAAG